MTNNFIITEAAGKPLARSTPPKYSVLLYSFHNRINPLHLMYTLSLYLMLVCSNLAWVHDEGQKSVMFR